jgi:hypothetical protein
MEVLAYLRAVAEHSLREQEDDNPTEIRAGYLWNISIDCYHYTNMLIKIILNYTF